MRASALWRAPGKCAFLAARPRRAAGLANVEVVHSRAEAWTAGLGAMDVATARAVAPTAVLAEYAAPLLVDGGVLVAWKGRRDADEEHDAAAAAEVLGLDVEAAVPVRPTRAPTSGTWSCCARWPRRPPATRGGRAWRASSRSVCVVPAGRTVTDP